MSTARKRRRTPPVHFDALSGLKPGDLKWLLAQEPSRPRALKTRVISRRYKPLSSFVALDYCSRCSSQLTAGYESTDGATNNPCISRVRYGGHQRPTADALMR